MKYLFKKTKIRSKQSHYSLFDEFDDADEVAGATKYSSYLLTAF